MKKHKKIIILSLINVLPIILLLVFALNFSHLANILLSQRAAERWKGGSEENFAQISCFLPRGEEIGEYSVLAFRNLLDNRLRELSLEAPEGGALWKDAYSALGTLSIKSDRGTFKADAIGIGGDYFFFHPLFLLSGSYISGDDLMKDRIVIDEDLAWQLFGSNDVQGKTVYISNAPFLIAGVVSREEDSASVKVSDGTSRVYVPLEALPGSDRGVINTYEIVMPNKVSGYAYNLIKDNFQVGGGEVIENSGRFSVENIFKLIGNYGERSIQDSGVKFPYWENAARITEDRLALLIVLILIFSTVPLVTAIYLIVKLFKALLSRRQRLYDFIRRKVEVQREKRRVKQKAKLDEKKRNWNRGSNTPRKKKARTAVKKTVSARGAKTGPEVLEEEYDEEIRLDIESIVREMLDEKDNSE